MGYDYLDKRKACDFSGVDLRGFLRSVSRDRIGLKPQCDVTTMRQLVPALLTASAHAQAPARTEGLVYGVNAATPDGIVVGTLVPREVDTVYLLADRTSVVSPRRTEIYFWPITNRYRAAMGVLPTGTRYLAGNGA